MGRVDSSVMGQGASRQQQETAESGARVAAGDEDTGLDSPALTASSGIGSKLEFIGP